ncbi:uncharacterized protein [Misgurnus anguillicaudatus]|uniref:uncharacterized protein n=1 Tax=Misgurnus anguillicaudatus TaxID=75329 RepID=UPI003CCF9D74
MSGLLVLCCFSLLVADVFGANDVTVSMMMGDDVTLPSQYVINNDNDLMWWFEGKIIAGSSHSKHTDERFNGRLELNRQTGSLTIRNISIKDTGVYTWHFMGRREEKKNFNVTVNDQVYKVSVMKGGDSFFLPTGVQIQQDDVKVWKFKRTDLTNGIFSNMNVNQQTGELNITNIRADQSGEYEVKIDGRSLILHRTFNVYFSDKVMSRSGLEGKSITLNIDNETQADDVIEWKFKNTLIAKVERRISPLLLHKPDERFSDRVNIDLFGSLIINDLKIEDTGLYDVNISNSNHFIHKRFSLTVTDEQNHWKTAGIILIVVVVVIVLGIIMKMC